MEIITFNGIVLKHIAVGESDWAVTILTVERGKISAFARGARRPGSHLSGLLEPFCFGVFKVYEGRSSYSIMEIDIKEYFAEFRQNLQASCYGTFFLELSDYYSRENADDNQLLRLLFLSLKALCSDSFDDRLVRCIFEERALVIDGEYPGIPANREWLPDTRYTMAYIAESSLDKLFSFKVSSAVLNELSCIIAIYRQRFIDRRMKSIEVLSMFEPGVEKQ